VLETIVRQQVDWQRDATKLFGSLEARQALELHQSHGTFKTICESRLSGKTTVERYCLARQLSGRIWREMEEDLGLKNATQAELEEHQDFELYEQWREIRSDAIEIIIKRFDSHEVELKEKGLDLHPLIEEWKEARGELKS
ncbi:MAG: hypothetical protein ABL958_20740, partial [Bdellovibrionia bacterium]